tara:strand:- start:1339 stop:1545 length:207 start_codon:yes stop_codon:yes gene_type:complete
MVEAFIIDIIERQRRKREEGLAQRLPLRIQDPRELPVDPRRPEDNRHKDYIGYRRGYGEVHIVPNNYI